MPHPRPIPQRAFTLGPALALAVLLAGCDGGQDEAPTLGTMQQMMANEVQPAAETYWQAVRSVSELVDGQPVLTDYQPRTEAEWEEVRKAAARLGELGVILQQPAYTSGRADDWVAFSKGLVDMAALAEQAAVAKDPEAVFEAGGLVYNVCRACHQMYPPANLAEITGEAEPRPGEGMTLEEYVEGN